MALTVGFANDLFLDKILALSKLKELIETRWSLLKGWDLSFLTLSKMTKFWLFQTEIVRRWQF